MAIDPACGMTVDPTTAPAVRHHQEHNYFFCRPECAEAFDTESDRYLERLRS